MATPMMEQYHRIKKQYPEEVIFFRMGDFFEMFHDDAVTAHKVLGITLTKRSHGKGKASQTPLAGFPHHQLENYLARMTRAGKRVVVVEQMEDPKLAKGLVKRDIVRIVTAGTNLSEEALDSDRNQFLAGVVVDGKRAGVALCDVTTGEFAAASVLADDLKDRLDLLRPHEVIFDEDSRDEVQALLPGKPMLTPLPPWIFDLDFARDTLTGHFKVDSLKGFGLEEDDAASRAAGAVLHYVRENLRTDPEHIRGLTRLPVDNFLLIDSATRRNLEIVEPSWGTDPSNTLFAHIDRTVTPFGRRLFHAQILRPLLDHERIEGRLDAVQEFFERTKLRDGLRERLRSLGDLERLTARLSTGRGSPRDAAALRDTLVSLPGIRSHLEDAKAAFIRSNSDQIDHLEDLVAVLQDAIIEEPPATLMHGGAIRPGYDERLDELRTIARGGKDYILARQEEEREKTGIGSLTISYNKVFGYYIEITKVHQDKVPEHYIRKQTLVNAERYITPDLKEWEEKIIRAEEEGLELERKLFEDVRMRIARDAERIQHDAHLLADLDTLAAAADLAVRQRYTRPKLRKDGRLMLMRSRHPVIENLLPPGESFVANDLDIGDDKHQVGLVTGPNMGGKSTYLRQVGLVVLMAHAGLFVPAEEAQIPLTDRIFTRVGASDNLAGGESTFLVEMHEAANILHNATGRSLILLDEIGRGTSTFDGLSIAWAIVEYLHDFPEDARPKTLFATHYHELTELETVLTRVYNLHVQVKEWGERVVFLRKVLPGRSGASYGIQVARLAGVPRKVIDRASEVLATLEASEFTDQNLPRLAAGSGAPQIPPPQDDPLQMTLFTVEERAVRDELAKADIDNMTPMEALRLLADLRDKYASPADKSENSQEEE
ncbi:DNA mismatch repair protein MutS [bacterium]|nr:DNA mismatch repair protein MutS [bacterium]